MSVDDWPKPPTSPQVRRGQLIRSRRILQSPMTSHPVRNGGLEPKIIVAETRQFVIYRVWSSKGDDLGERVVERAAFESEYERGEFVDYVDLES